MAHWICYTTATHRGTAGPYDDFPEAQTEMRREARYYRARNGYIVEADEPSEAPEVEGGLEFACDYGDDILDTATA